MEIKSLKFQYKLNFKSNSLTACKLRSLRVFLRNSVVWVNFEGIFSQIDFDLSLSIFKLSFIHHHHHRRLPFFGAETRYDGDVTRRNLNSFFDSVYKEHLPTTTMKVINSGYEISASLMTLMYIGGWVSCTRENINKYLSTSWK